MKTEEARENPQKSKEGTAVTTLKDYIPLVVAVGSVLVFSVLFAIYNDLSFMRWMQVFMGVFFLVFGLLKLARLSEFAEAYRVYDLLAARSKLYAHLYPFIEFVLGVAYLFAFGGSILYVVTAAVMLISAVSVYNTLRKRERVLCACLGAVFRIPMTWVTLFEDVLMFAMAVYMLVVAV